ncbi:MAG TPA: hypothetical protein VJ964_07230 [Balneolaceae bacterium]|nr:hypothetical protein [Balneolaceae bacterium]
MKTIKGVNFKSYIAASLIAGYVMFQADKFLGGTLGLFGFFPGTKDWGWMLAHHVDSIIFALPFVWLPLYNKLPGSGWLKGVVYGFLFWLVMDLIVGSIVAGLGSTYFQAMGTPTFGVIISFILLHVIWGFMLGVLYNPPEASTAGV